MRTLSRIEFLATLLILCGAISATSVFSQPPAAPTEAKKPPAPPEPVTAKIDTDKIDDADVPAGHSQHGEIFNEGLRQKANLMSGTGVIKFPVTTAHSDAQKFVEQGIGQLHGFWYLEAERSFRQAATIDPDCAIAYWGMAMANGRNSKRSKGFIAEAVKRKDKAGKMEVMFIDALNNYLNHKSKKRAIKSKAYVAELKKIVKDFPNEIEAHAALGYAYYRYRGDLKLKHEDVEKKLNEVLAMEPRHPVHHFRIHLWDYKNPSKVVNSAAQCGQAAAGIAHMWHMPGHIFSRLKRYEDAAWQQEASARVDHAHMMRDQVLPDQIHNFAHNNEWLIRNLINVGRWRDAADLAKNMTELPRHPKYNTLRRGSGRYGRMRLFDVLKKYEQWDEIIELCYQSYLEPSEIESEQVKRLRYLGVAYANTGDLEKANEVVAQLNKRMLAAKAKAKEKAKTKTKSKAKPKSTPKPPDVSDSPAPPPPVPRPAKAKAPTKKTLKPKAPIVITTASVPPAPPLPRAAKPPKPAKRKSNPYANYEKAIAAIEGYMALHKKDYKSALAHLKKAGADRMDQARVQCLVGEVEPALKQLESYMKSQQKRVQPLARKIDILWIADKKKEAKASFEQLRGLSSSIQIDSPVFARLAPIAKELELPEDWRVIKPLADDIGERPDLATLGPFRWQPMPAKSWTLDDHENKPLSLKQFRGKPIVVIFYLGYGCLHCAEQIQAFAPKVSKYAEAGISVVAISTDDKKGLKVSLENYKGEMPISLVSNAKLDVFKAYRVFDDFEDVPLHGTFLIDGDGYVRWQDISYEPFMDVDFLLKESKRLLAQPKVGADKAS